MLPTWGSSRSEVCAINSSTFSDLYIGFIPTNVINLCIILGIMVAKKWGG